jgi:hypothetical protein
MDVVQSLPILPDCADRLCCSSTLVPDSLSTDPNVPSSILRKTIQYDRDLFISSIASTWGRLKNDAAVENLQNEIMSSET